MRSHAQTERFVARVALEESARRLARREDAQQILEAKGVVCDQPTPQVGSDALSRLHFSKVPLISVARRLFDWARLIVALDERKHLRRQIIRQSPEHV
jgi:hypothetical protein